DWRSGPMRNPAACCATGSCGISDCGGRRTKGAGGGSIFCFSAARSWPAHKVGLFRYLECAGLGQDGRPVGEITDWDDIRFPFDPGLEEGADLAAVSVRRTPTTSDFVVEETYTCDSSGN